MTMEPVDSRPRPSSKEGITDGRLAGRQARARCDLDGPKVRILYHRLIVRWLNVLAIML